jgi:hypothetical protein
VDSAFHVIGPHGDILRKSGVEHLLGSRKEGSSVLPNFLLIGSRKSGTSSLYEYLRGHPEIFMTREKEPSFFGGNWSSGLEWYEHLFEGVGTAMAIGEASTEYSVFPYVPNVPARIAELIPDVRLIYLVRHPIERMLSEYHYNVIRGLERNSSADRSLLTKLTYECASRYALQVEQYLEHFDRSQLLIVRSEDLRRDRLRTLRRIYTFLGVNASWEPLNIEQEFNRSSQRRRRPLDGRLRKLPGYRVLASVAPSALRDFKRQLTTAKAPPRPALSDRARSELEDRLRDDVRQLRRHMDGNFDGWGIA